MDLQRRSCAAGDTGPVVVGRLAAHVPGAGATSSTTCSRCDQEQDTLGLVAAHAAARRRSALVLLLGGIAWLVTRQVVHAGPDGGADRRAARGRPARGADEGARRGRPRPARRVLQPDGRQPAAPDPPARGAVPGAAPVRLRRVARAAHAADHGADGGRRPPRRPRATSTRPSRAVRRAAADQLDRFESLLADLLEISRFDAGAAVLDAEPTDLRDVARRVDRRRRAAGRRARAASCVLVAAGRAVHRRGRQPADRAHPAQPGGQRDRARRGAARRGRASRPTTTRSRWRCATTGSACGPARRRWSSTGSGGPTRPARGPPAAPGSGLSIALEDARLHGGWLQAWGEPGRRRASSGSRCRGRRAASCRLADPAGAPDCRRRSAAGPGGDACRRSGPPGSRREPLGPPRAAGARPVRRRRCSTAVVPPRARRSPRRGRSAGSDDLRLERQDPAVRVIADAAAPGRRPTRSCGLPAGHATPATTTSSRASYLTPQRAPAWRTGAGVTVYDRDRGCSSPPTGPAVAVTAHRGRQRRRRRARYRRRASRARGDPRSFTLTRVDGAAGASADLADGLRASRTYDVERTSAGRRCTSCDRTRARSCPTRLPAPVARLSTELVDRAAARADRVAGRAR